MINTDMNRAAAGTYPDDVEEWAALAVLPEDAKNDEMPELTHGLLFGDGRACDDAAADIDGEAEGPAANRIYAVPPGGLGRPVEKKGQHYRDAAAALIDAMRAEAGGRSPAATPDMRALLPVLNREILRHAQGLTAEAVLEELLAMAAGEDERSAESDEDAAPGPNRVRRLEKMFEKAVSRAGRRIARRQRRVADAAARGNTAEADLAMKKLLEARSPAFLSRPPHDWSSRHDGDLLDGRLYRALGIVRWARSLSPERAQRIGLLCATLADEAGLTGREASEASLAFAQARPMIVLSSVTTLTTKLVRDLWALEPRVAVVVTGTAAQRLKGANPFAAFRIPLIADPKGWLSAFLAVETSPALVERVSGGIRITAPTGLADLTKRPDGPVPQWLLTMGEIGMLSRWTNEPGRDVMPIPKRIREKLAFFRTLAAMFETPAQTPLVPAEVRGIDREARKRFLENRDELRRIVNRQIVRLENIIRDNARRDREEGRTAQSRPKAARSVGEKA